MLAAAAGLGLATANVAEPQRETSPGRRALTADEALGELLEGNRRFTAGKPVTPRRSPADFRVLAHGQFPEAIVVSCADSRVAPEILFDVGIGDIFVVRVAGNVIGGAGVTVKGSIEYAIEELNAPLILVLGHAGCGAVKAAIQHINAKDSLPGAINGLVELIKPAVTKSRGMAGNPLENAIRENVRLGVATLRALGPIVAPKVKAGKVKVAGGIYDLQTGAVTLVD